MTNIDNLMKNATYEQKVILRELQGLVVQEKNLIDETKKSCDKENRANYCYPRLEPDDVFRPMNDEQAQNYLKNYSSASKRRLEEIQGKIKKTIADAKSKGILVVDYNSL